MCIKQCCQSFTHRSDSNFNVLVGNGCPLLTYNILELDDIRDKSSHTVIQNIMLLLNWRHIRLHTRQECRAGECAYNLLHQEDCLNFGCRNGDRAHHRTNDLISITDARSREFQSQHGQHWMNIVLPDLFMQVPTQCTNVTNQIFQANLLHS